MSLKGENMNIKDFAKYVHDNNNEHHYQRQWKLNSFDGVMHQFIHNTRHDDRTVYVFYVVRESGVVSIKKAVFDYKGNQVK